MSTPLHKKAALPISIPNSVRAETIHLSLQPEVALSFHNSLASNLKETISRFWSGRKRAKDCFATESELLGSEAEVAWFPTENFPIESFGWTTIPTNTADMIMLTIGSQTVSLRFPISSCQTDDRSNNYNVNRAT